MNFFNTAHKETQNKTSVDNMRLYNLLNVPKQLMKKKTKKAYLKKSMKGEYRHLR